MIDQLNSENTINIHEASIILALPEFLLRDFVRYPFNERRLSTVSGRSEPYLFQLDDVNDFRNHLNEAWPGEGRQPPPKFIERYLKFESQGKCAFCKEKVANYEYAHIRGWADSRCHSPHNLLRLCLDCHRTHGNDQKLLQGIKEECLRRIHQLDNSLLYDCEQHVSPGNAVYVLEGHAHLACAGEKSDRLACGFVHTKVGVDRCTVQRTGLVVSIGKLEPGMEYLLSLKIPGNIVTRTAFNAEITPSKESIAQFVGRAESGTHLAIGSLGTYLGLKPGAYV